MFSILWEYVVIFATGSQIINHLLVWYNHMKNYKTKPALMWKILTVEDWRGHLTSAIMPRTVSGRTEKVKQGKQLIYCTLVSTSSRKTKRGKKNKKKKKLSHGVDRLKKGLWYGPAILCSKLSENVQDIRQCYKIHHASWENGKWNS